MRPRHAPRCAGQAELLAALDDIADGHVDLRKVQLGRIEAVTMIDIDGVAAEKQLLRQDDAAAVGRMDLSARACAKVGSRMRRSRLTVEHAPMAEVAPVLRTADGHLESLR